MKKKVTKLAIGLMVLFTMLDVSSAMAASIYEGDLSLGTQAEVNGFNYGKITGSLTIAGEDIVDLTSLSVLTSIGKYLAINHTALTEVENAFPRLKHVGGGIYFYYNNSLVSFSGFDMLMETGDNIDFWYNDSLIIVAGFSALKTAGWSLEFGGNPVLTKIPEFESLETIASSLFILDNTSLTSIKGFDTLQYVDWSFQIVGNTQLNNLCGFYNYFSANNPYTGDGYLGISNNHPDCPSTIQDILDGGPCYREAIEAIDSLIAEIEAMALPTRISNSLIRPLANAQKFLAEDNVGSATNQLEWLINKIEFLVLRGKLDGATADELVDAVLAIIDLINS